MILSGYILEREGMHYVFMVVLRICGWSYERGEKKSGGKRVELVKGGDMWTVSNEIYADNVVPCTGSEADVCRLSKVMSKVILRTGGAREASVNDSKERIKVSDGAFKSSS